MSLGSKPIADEPFLAIMVEAELAVHHYQGATLVEHARPGGKGLVAIGDPAPVASLLTEYARSEHESITIPRGAWELLPQSVRTLLDLELIEDWDWLEITHVPMAPHMAGVRELLMPQELPALNRVREESIPNSFLTPDTLGSRWFGWFAPEGDLRAVGGVLGFVSGAWPQGAHFGSIGTQPRWQGQGIGAGLTAGMIKWAFNEGAHLASLGVYVENQRAIKMYERLGFVTKYRLHSRNRAQ